MTAKEYAIMCQTNGTVFVDVSTPSTPIIIGRLASYTGNSSLWRDIKVYNNYAFIVADANSGHGMQVFDLTELRDVSSPPEQFTETAHYDGVSSAHNIVINEAKGIAYIVGARNASNNCGQGGLHIVNISDPLNPVYAGCFDADGYTHDAQVVTYNGPDADYSGKEIAFNSNENTITIADVSDPGNTSLISKQGYSQSAYAHQGWLTEDHQYFISNDELDEINGLVPKTRTLVWDVRDLDNPSLISQYFSEREAIDHNLYVKDEKIYQSNYENGLVILDASKIGEPNIRELAFFDTYPQNNSTDFNGAWSNYPFFASGNIVVSDINNGLFVLKPKLLNIFDGPPIVSKTDGITSISIKTEAAIQVASYQWQLINELGYAEDIEDSAVFTGLNTAIISFKTAVGRVIATSFRCKVTLANGNVGTSFLTEKLQVDDIIIANEVKKQLAAIIYPNPVKNNLQIDLSSTDISIETIAVYNATGSFISSYSAPIVNNINTLNWDEGIYLLIITDKEGNKAVKRIVKE